MPKPATLVRRDYGQAIGQPVEAVTTPALLLDLPAARRNIARMAEGMAGLPAALRPHVKGHKSPDLARLQAEAGAQGFSTATVWEAVILAEAGFDDLFVVNTVAGAAKIARLVDLARERRVLVAVDDLENARDLSRAATQAGSTLGVLIEIDTGMRRAGLTDPTAAAALAQQLADLPGLRFEGVTGYEGHCSLEDDVGERMLKQRAAMDVLLAAVAAIEDAGVPCSIVSAGGTRTWWLTAATPGVTEIQAGTYVLMDRFHSGVEGGFEPALRVLTTVISRSPQRIIVDAGNKSVAAPDLTVDRRSTIWPISASTRNTAASRHHPTAPSPSATSSSSFPATPPRPSTCTTPTTSSRTARSSTSGPSFRAAPATMAWRYRRS